MILYILQCKCVMKAVAMSDEVLCLVHNQESKPIDIHVYEWHSVCTARGCPWGRWCGLSQDLAKIMARQHAQHKNHETKVKYERNPVAQTVLDKMRRQAAI